MKTDTRFHQLIAAKRVALGCSNEYIANVLGISKTTLISREKDHQNMTIRELRRLPKLGCTAKEIEAIIGIKLEGVT